MHVLTCRAGPHRLAIDTRSVQEVVPWVPLQPVAKNGLAGWLVQRGRMVPVIDLHRLLECGECPRLLSSRIVLVRVRAEVIGLLAAQVSALCEIALDVLAPPALIERQQEQLGPLVVVDHEVWHLLEPERLLDLSYREGARA